VVLEHFAGSPDFAPCDFFLFPTMKEVTFLNNERDSDGYKSRPKNVTGELFM
jgi:hypothetical protein